jgi:hypothetical protein
VLDDDDFALVDETDPESSLPVVPISEALWRNIMGLPDDVAIRTTDHYGDILRTVSAVNQCLVRLSLLLQYNNVHPSSSAISSVVCDSSDDIDAAIYCATVGYYRFAFSGLREVLEKTVIAVWLELEAPDRITAWLHGTDFKFNAACVGLNKCARFEPIRAATQSETNDDFFQQGNPPIQRAGYVRRLYKHLCNYAHARPGYTQADLLNSNGPIFHPPVLYKWLNAFGATIVTSAFLARQCLPTELVNRELLLQFRNVIERMLYLVPPKGDGRGILLCARDLIDAEVESQ